MIEKTLVDILKTSIIESDNETLVLNTINGAIISSKSNRVTRLTGIAGGDKPRFEIHAIRGSLENPQVLLPGDYGVTLSFTTFLEENNHDISKSLVSLLSRMDPSANQNDSAPASSLLILVGAGDGNGDLLGNYMNWRFQNNGALESKILQCIEQDKTSINKIIPKKGMIIYNSEIDKFQGYTADGWVDLH